jgi:hypothetical protein
MRKTYFTTDPPFVTFETTQIYLPQDFTTADLEFVDNANANLNSGEHGERRTDAAARFVADANPFWWEVGPEGMDPEAKETLAHSKVVSTRKRRRNLNRHKRKHHHRDHHQKQYHHHDHHRLAKRDVLQSSSLNMDTADLAADNYYNNVDDLFYVETSDVVGNILNENDAKPFDGSNNNNHNSMLDSLSVSQDVIMNDTTMLDNDINNLSEIANRQQGQQQQQQHEGGVAADSEKGSGNYDDNGADIKADTSDQSLHRVKRKSGKATGALSRAKAGSDSSSSKKSGHRHKQGEGECVLFVQC